MDGRPETSPLPIGKRVEQLARTRYVIVFAIRSGSTLLCNDLAQAGLGRPTEHFQGPAVTDPAAAFVERVVAADAPVFGTKVSWEQTFAVLRRLADEGQIRAFDLREVFGEDLGVVRLVRRNKLRQAISAWRATSSGIWHVPSGSVPVARSPGYDKEALLALMMQVLAEDWLWERHFQDAGLETLTIDYEDYVEDRAGWVAEIARHVGLPLATAPDLADRTQPMADLWTDRIEERLLDDLSAPVHPFWAVPGLQSVVPSSLPLDRCIPLPRVAPPFPTERLADRRGRLAGVAGESGEPG
jgi:LPS sulfotransferase NodH